MNRGLISETRSAGTLSTGMVVHDLASYDREVWNVDLRYVSMYVRK
jgi:hypothetical protein